jgi:3-deoxy-manno-octulosonate cytidylyltransferase (CMP-KDO synthetase)
MSKVVGIIPVRWASTRFPGKPLHGIAGKPLIRHVWERCVEAGCFDQIVVATDDMRIAEAVFNFGAEVALTAADHPSGTDRIAEVARKLKKASIILNIQGDEPLLEPALLEQLARELKDNRDISIVTAATPASVEESQSEDNVKVVIDRKGNALYFSRSCIPFRRGKSDVTTYKHLGIYDCIERVAEGGRQGLDPFGKALLGRHLVNVGRGLSRQLITAADPGEAGRQHHSPCQVGIGTRVGGAVLDAG